MKEINKYLRVLICIGLIILLSLGSIYMLLGYSISGIEVFTDYLGIVYMSFIVILFIFIKNKSSDCIYNILLIIIGVFIIKEHHEFYLHYRKSFETYIHYIFSVSSLFDIVPLSLVYFSTICTYLVCKKEK